MSQSHYEKKDVYIATCTQLKVGSPGGVLGEDTQVVFHQSDGRGHDADKSQHVVQTRVQRDVHQVTQQTRKRGKRHGFEGLRGRGRVFGNSILIFFFCSRRIVGLEDTSEIRSDQRLLTISRSSSS